MVQRREQAVEREGRPAFGMRLQSDPVREEMLVMIDDDGERAEKAADLYSREGLFVVGHIPLRGPIPLGVHIRPPPR